MGRLLMSSLSGQFKFHIISEEIEIIRNTSDGSPLLNMGIKGHKTKMPIGRAIKQNRLEVGRVAKQNAFLSKKSGALPVL